jgi:hypothetical protein
MDEIASGDAPGVVVGSRAHLVKSEAVVKVRLLLPCLNIHQTSAHWSEIS